MRSSFNIIFMSILTICHLTLKKRSKRDRKKEVVGCKEKGVQKIERIQKGKREEEEKERTQEDKARKQE